MKVARPVMELNNVQYLQPCNINIYSFIPYWFTAELIKDIIREREVKDDIERQLSQEQKLRGEWNFYPQRLLCGCVFWGKSVKTSITAHLSKRRFARGPLWQLHQRSFAFRSSTDAFVSRQSLELMPRSCTMGKVRSGLCGAKSPLLIAPCCWCCWMNHPNQLTPKGVQVCLTGYPMMIPFEWDCSCTLSCLWVDVECFGIIHECVKEREFNQRSTGEKELLQVEFWNIHDPI